MAKGGKKRSPGKGVNQNVVKWAGAGNRNVNPRMRRQNGAEKDEKRINFLRDHGCRELELTRAVRVPRGRDNQGDVVNPLVEAQVTRFASMFRKRRIYLEKLVNDDGTKQMKGDRRGIVTELENDLRMATRDIRNVRNANGEPLDVPDVLLDLPPRLNN